MNVSLTPKLEAFVRRKVASGLYNNASEVVREALRAQFEREPGHLPERAADAPALSEVRAILEGMQESLRERGITSLALFGSLVRGEAGPASDIDILIDVDPAARFSLLDLAALEEFLGERFGRKVDAVTREGLDPRLREAVQSEARVVF